MRRLFHLTWFIVFYIICPASIATLSKSNSALPENNVDQLPLYGREFPSFEDTDGNVFPSTLNELITSLGEQIPQQLITVEYNTEGEVKKAFLNLTETSHTHNAFFALKQIYPDNIECDTVTLLIAYQQTKTPLPLDELDAFLKARITIQENENVSGQHPYHKGFRKLLFRLGTLKYNLLHVPLKNILTKFNPHGIVLIAGHVAVITHISENKYIISGWDEGGIYFNKVTYSGEGMLNEDWGGMEIRSYLHFAKPRGKPSLSSSKKKQRKTQPAQSPQPILLNKKVMNKKNSSSFESFDEPDSVNTKCVHQYEHTISLDQFSESKDRHKSMKLSHYANIAWDYIWMFTQWMFRSHKQ